MQNHPTFRRKPIYIYNQQCTQGNPEAIQQQKRINLCLIFNTRRPLMKSIRYLRKQPTAIIVKVSSY